jgi:hypothetical protein
MAFSKSQLQSDLEDVFSSMNSDDDSVFADGLSEAFMNFVNSGVPSTEDSGTVSAGTFTGASTGGSLSASDSACASIITQAFSYMKSHESGGDDYLAGKIAEGLKKMTDDTVVTTSVTGTAVPPSPPPPSVPVSGTAKGTITCDTATLEAKLKSVFSGMKSMQSGGDTYFAQKLAEEVYNCLKAGEVKTEGQGALEGSSGSGTAS